MRSANDFVTNDQINDVFYMFDIKVNFSINYLSIVSN